MIIFLSRLLAQFKFLRRWKTPMIVLAVVFATSWPLMVLAESASNAIVEPQNFWWYFVITASTVGYGDFVPKTGEGHAVGAYILFGGIASLASIFTTIGRMLEEAKGRRMSGAITVRTTGHLVVLGYHPGRTELIIEQLLADNSGKIVLCGWSETATHPMPGRDAVQFVRGDLTDEAVLRRAGVHKARGVLVDAREDNEALAMAVTVDYVVDGAHIVVALRDMRQARLLRRVDDSVHCVQWHTPRMITEELTSPGITDIYAELMNAGGPDTYSTDLPASVGAVQVEHCQIALGRRHGATLLAAKTGERLVVNPAWQDMLPPACTLFYVSSQRLTADQIVRAITDLAPER